MSSRAVVYRRELPGGGFAAIEAEGEDAGGRGARLWVERRGELARRAGHTPPVIARAQGDDLAGAIAELRAIADDNVALALALRRWRRGEGAGVPPSAAPDVP
jgi:hypothetical protein